MADRTNLVPGNDEFRMTLGANVQIGTEFDVVGSFSIRVDVFGRLRFVERTYGQTLAKLDQLTPFAAGLAAMDVWSFE
jgi:hypothetical protein